MPLSRNRAREGTIDNGLFSWVVPEVVVCLSTTSYLHRAPSSGSSRSYRLCAVGDRPFLAGASFTGALGTSVFFAGILLAGTCLAVTFFAGAFSNDLLCGSRFLGSSVL
jgi:hypothetical protein